MTSNQRQDPHHDHDAFAGEASVWMPRLLRLLDAQLERCESLVGLTSVQHEALEADDVDTLLDVLSQRQRLIDEIVRISGELAPFRERRERLLSGVDPVSRKQVEVRVERIATLIERVESGDTRDRETLERKRSDVAKELVKMNTQRGAVAAYSSRGPASPRYQDREC